MEKKLALLLQVNIDIYRWNQRSNYFRRKHGNTSTGRITDSEFIMVRSVDARKKKKDGQWPAMMTRVVGRKRQRSTQMNN